MQLKETCFWMFKQENGRENAYLYTIFINLC